MSLNHFNHLYDGGSPDVPYGVGDRYYSQDLARDFWFLYSAVGVNLKNMYKSFPILIKDTYIEKGTGWNQIDIPIAGGLVEYDVDVPNSFATIPPTKTTETTLLYVESTAQTDYTMSAATLDGVTTNYVKLTYNETNGNSRNRAKKAGSYNYERVRSFTFTVSSAAPTNRDLVLAEIVGDGATFLTIDRKVRTPRYNDPYDYVVNSQDSFNQIITRVAANQYKIIDDIKSVYFEELSGGYLCTGATSFLDGGDTWGYIETNNCQHIEFESGACLHTGILQGYLKVDTDDCVLRNVEVSGTKGTPAAISRSFLLAANRATYINCKSQTRDSNVDFAVFEGSATAAHNTSSKYIGCLVNNHDSSDKLYGFKGCQNISNCHVKNMQTTVDHLYGFYQCYNLNNCTVIEIDNTTSGYMYGYYGCNRLTNCIIEDADSSYYIYCYYNCNMLNSCYAYDIAATAQDVVGFINCTGLSSCKAYFLDANSHSVYGYYNCDNMSGCIVEDIDSVSGSATAFYMCDNISACYAYDVESGSGAGYGYFQCNQVSGCTAYQIDGATTCHGFYDCDDISGCRAEDIDGGTGQTYGFQNCQRLSACSATDIDSASANAYGIADCTYGSSLWTDEALNAGNDWIDTVDAQITNKVSTPSVWT